MWRWSPQKSRFMNTLYMKMEGRSQESTNTSFQPFNVTEEFWQAEHLVAKLEQISTINNLPWYHHRFISKSFQSFASLQLSGRHLSLAQLTSLSGFNTFSNREAGRGWNECNAGKKSSTGKIPTASDCVARAKIDLAHLPCEILGIRCFFSSSLRSGDPKYRTKNLLLKVA